MKVPSCRDASTLKVTVPGTTPSLLHFVPSGRSTTNLQSPFHGWASAVQPVLSAMRAQSGPHGVTTQVELHTGPIRDEGAAEIGGPGGACEADGGAGEDGGCCKTCGDVHAVSRSLAAYNHYLPARPLSQPL